MAEISCTATIVNNTDSTLTLASYPLVDGKWTQTPTASIAPNGTGSWTAQSDAAQRGTEGHVAYSVSGSGTVTMRFNVRYSGGNDFSIAVPDGFTGSSDDPQDPTAKVTYTISNAGSKG